MVGLAALHQQRVKNGLPPNQCSLHQSQFEHVPDSLTAPLIAPSETVTACPLKGDAAYFSLGEHQDVAWSYQAGTSRPPPMLG
ncbi:DUF427 domain-containing protein [Halomonas sp. BC04]|uniref:DUF427 domain-containing protein n=1 Tax=Halomonas sp. BC04 TaxID=1403540 RepID=UPI0009DE9A3B|nr:DUF427 domain-containing protein [Halomonas sp. BC04]